MNPFRFGNVVSGEYFTNRKKEIKEMLSELKAGQHIVLMSPRRYGKTSLMNEVMKASGIKWFRINMELIADEVDLANYYVRDALSLSKFEKIKHYLKNLKVQPYIQIQPKTNEISVSFDTERRNISTLLLDSLQLPETIAKSIKKRIVIVFDEFQEIRRISPNLEKKMRGIFQYHQNITYVFIGSQESMIREIFQNKNNPFYKFGRHITLHKIPEPEFSDFIIKRFSSQKIDADKIVKDILKFTNCHPYYTQQLCHEIYILNEENILTRHIIDKAVDQITTEHHADYSRWWNSLTNTERKVIIGIASGDYSPTSQEFIRKYGIKSTSTSGSVVGKLVALGTLVKKNGDKIKIEDPFWKVWILKNRD
ncbi:MAG: ATP-binding protein [Candidatus Omnitrophica bacterium]|nr:ATP-binding protein [Candidatus Omnitrophota bacterium]MBU2504505.1 ATP-binding protein [Candidatus Omnitrophota bacterium]